MNTPSDGKYESHLLECAEIAKKVAASLGLRDDSAVQACFATVAIDAQRHGVFIEPTPRNGKPTPQVAPEPAKAPEQTSSKPGDYSALVSPENVGAIKNPTPELAEAGERKALMEGVKKGCKLLNAAGFTPALTNITTPPMVMSTIDAYIVTELQIEKKLVRLDNDQLGVLVKSLTNKLDVFKHNVGGLEEGAGF